MNEQENPIDIKMVAENPGLMEYATSAGSAIIRPEDMGKVKGKAQLAMRQQTFDQLEKLYRQIELLSIQASEVKDRIEISERIYDAKMSFEPVINHSYYLYERKDGQDVLSMVGPDEWGKRLPFNQFLAKALLLADHTWKVEFVQHETESDFIDIDA